MLEPLGADRVNGGAKLLDMAGEPFELLGRDAIMFRVAGLHIGFFKIFEPCAVDPQLAWPAVDQAHIETLSLRAKEYKIMNVRSIESADQK